MANTRSAKKMVRKIAARTEVNKARRSRVRTYVRKVEEAIGFPDASRPGSNFASRRKVSHVT